MEKERAFITHVTENYLEGAHNLAKSMDLFSEVTLIVYIIDPTKERGGEFKKYKNVESRQIFLNLDKPKESDYFYTDGGNFYSQPGDRIYRIISAKTLAIEKALEEGWKEVCYLDSDCIATPLVDELFDWASLITDFPVATQGIHQYMITIENGISRGNPFENSWPSPDHKLCIEWHLMNFLEMSENQRGTYRTTNIVLANQKCLEFVKIWRKLCGVLPDLVDVKKHAPFHEETVYNVLSWKKKDPEMPLCYINLGEGLETVKHFYSDDAKEGTLRWSETDYSQNFYLIPDDKRNTKVLHGEKRTSEVELILEFLKNKNIK